MSKEFPNYDNQRDRNPIIIKKHMLDIAYFYCISNIS